MDLDSSRDWTTYVTPSIHSEPGSNAFAWMCKFEPLYEAAGMDPEDPLNRMELPDGAWPRINWYYLLVYERLVMATDGIEGSAFRQAFRDELAAVQEDASTPGRLLCGLIRRAP